MMFHDQQSHDRRRGNLTSTASYSVLTAKKKKKSKYVKKTEDEFPVSDSDHHHESLDPDSDDNESTDNSDDNDDIEMSESGGTETDEFATVKQELSNMSFEELIQLKERLGLKVYNQVVHGEKSSQTVQKKVFKRENKNRPMEMSSKRPIYHSKSSSSVKKKVSRDPRFDDLSGDYNEHYFKTNYSFVFDIKSREKEKIQKKLKKEKNPEKKSELVKLYNRMDQQEEAEKQKDKRKTIEKEWKKKEQSQVLEGKKPYFLKKTDLRKLELAEKYKDLKKSGKLDKYLSKKRKKTAQKEKKKLPLMQ